MITKIIAYITFLIPLYFHLTWGYIWFHFDFLSHQDKLNKFYQWTYLTRNDSSIVLLGLILLSTISLICFVTLLSNSTFKFDKFINLLFITINALLFTLSLWQSL